MAITDYYKIDGLGISNKNNEELILLITDNLSWEDERIHLQHLQNKISAYINYIKTKQYKNSYPDMDIEKFTIDIHMEQYPTNAGIQFLDIVNKDIIKDNIQITVDIKNEPN